MLNKRKTKVIAYRNSKLPKAPSGLKNNDFDEIGFLKGIKWYIYLFIFTLFYILYKFEENEM